MGGTAGSCGCACGWGRLRHVNSTASCLASSSRTTAAYDDVAESALEWAQRGIGDEPLDEPVPQPLGAIVHRRVRVELPLQRRLDKVLRGAGRGRGRDRDEVLAPG